MATENEMSTVTMTVKQLALAQFLMRLYGSHAYIKTAVKAIVGEYGMEDPLLSGCLDFFRYMGMAMSVHSALEVVRRIAQSNGQDVVEFGLNPEATEMLKTICRHPWEDPKMMMPRGGYQDAALKKAHQMVLDDLEGLRVAILTMLPPGGLQAPLLIPQSVPGNFRQ